MKTKKIIGLLLVSLILASCGGGSRGTGSFSSGIDPNRALETVSDPEKDQICGTFTEFTKRIVEPETLCTLVGLAAIKDEDFEQILSPIEDCELVKKVCIRRYDELFSSEDFSFECPIEDADFKDCNATIDELDTCMSSALDTFAGTLEEFSCQMATSDEDVIQAIQRAGAAVDPANLSECAPLRSTCPNFINE